MSQKEKSDAEPPSRPPVGAQGEEEFAALRHWLSRAYPAWQARLEPHWRSAMRGEPWPEGERETLMSDLRTKWKPLLSDAVADRRLTLVEDFGRGLLFKIQSDDYQGGNE